MKTKGRCAKTRSIGVAGVATLLLLVYPAARADTLAGSIKQVKSSVVAVGTYHPTRTPRAKLTGTGFVIGDGRHVITNAHVLPDVLDGKNKERIAVFAGQGSKPEVITAETVALDRNYDIAVLKMRRRKLPALRLGRSRGVEEGRRVAFTGFPIGSVLGLYPVTHTGIVSAITPIAVPVPAARQLNPKLIRRMRSSYKVFQLDATAYPGNSGSPVFDPATAEVIGIVNKVFVQGTKEALLENPSGITYAIPIHYAKDLLKKKGITLAPE